MLILGLFVVSAILRSNVPALRDLRRSAATAAPPKRAVSPCAVGSSPPSPSPACSPASAGSCTSPRSAARRRSSAPASSCRSSPPARSAARASKAAAAATWPHYSAPRSIGVLANGILLLGVPAIWVALRLRDLHPRRRVQRSPATSRHGASGVTRRRARPIDVVRHLARLARRHSRKATLLIVLVVLIVVFSLLSSDFLTSSNLLSTARRGVEIGADLDGDGRRHRLRRNRSLGRVDRGPVVGDARLLARPRDAPAG